VVAFELMQMNKMGGHKKHMITPIVDPSKPSTISIFGANKPTLRDTVIMKNVMHLKWASGMWLPPPVTNS